MTHGDYRVAAIAGAALALAISGTALSADGVGWSPGPAEWKGDLSPISSADWNYDRAAHLNAYGKPREPGFDSARAYFYKGRTLVKLGRYDDALKAYEFILSVRPEFEDAREAHATLLDRIQRDNGSS